MSDPARSSMLTAAPRGKGISDRSAPVTASCGEMKYARSSSPCGARASISIEALGGGGAADSTRSRRVTHGTVAPGNQRAHDDDEEHDIEDLARACDIRHHRNRREHDGHGAPKPDPPHVRRLAPAIAKWCEAERRNEWSRDEGEKQRQREADDATCHTRDGYTRSPRSRNISTWLNQPSASCTRRMPTACGSAPLPRITPVTYTARKPLPCISVVTPNERQAIASVNAG